MHGFFIYRVVSSANKDALTSSFPRLLNQIFSGASIQLVTLNDCFSCWSLSWAKLCFMELELQATVWKASWREDCMFTLITITLCDNTSWRRQLIKERVRIQDDGAKALCQEQPRVHILIWKQQEEKSHWEWPEVFKFQSHPCDMLSPTGP